MPEDYRFAGHFAELQPFPGTWTNGKLLSVVTHFGILGVACITDAVTEDEVDTCGASSKEKIKGNVGRQDRHRQSLGNRRGGLGLGQGKDQRPAQSNRRSLSLWRHRLLAEGWADDGLGGDCRLDHWCSAEGRGQGCRPHPARRRLSGSKRFCIGDISSHGQVNSAEKVAVPALIPKQKGWDLSAQVDPAEAKRQDMAKDAGTAMDVIQSARIKERQWPVQQDLGTGNDFRWEYKTS